MTDFFADLEREIRAAHPRRPRPAVPVRAIVATGAVATMLAAVVLGIGAIGTTESDVASSPLENGWTEYAPLICGGAGEVADGRIPDELLDRFAILRGDERPFDLPAAEVPHAAAEVIRQSIRLVEGPEQYRYVIAVARLNDDNCRPGNHAICLISLTTEGGVCGPAGRDRFTMSLVEDRPDGRDLHVLVAEDGVRRASADAAKRVPIEGNVGFLLR